MQVHRYLVESSRFPEGQLRDAKLHVRALSVEEVRETHAGCCGEMDSPPFPIPKAVQESCMNGNFVRPSEEDDHELAVALAMSLAAHRNDGESASDIDTGTEHCHQMLGQVMAMGFDKASSKNALE